MTKTVRTTAAIRKSVIRRLNGTIAPTQLTPAQRKLAAVTAANVKPTAAKLAVNILADHAAGRPVTPKAAAALVKADATERSAKLEAAHVAAKAAPVVAPKMGAAARKKMLAHGVNPDTFAAVSALVGARPVDAAPVAVAAPKVAKAKATGPKAPCTKCGRVNDHGANCRNGAACAKRKAGPVEKAPKAAPAAKAPKAAVAGKGGK